MSSVEGEITELKIFFVPGETIPPIRVINELLEYLNLALKRKQLKEFNVQIGEFLPIEKRFHLLIHKVANNNETETVPIS